MTIDQFSLDETMFSETSSLLGNSQRTASSDSRNTWRYIGIIPALFFTILGTQLHIYVVNEWTQYRIRSDQFIGSPSAWNFSACGDTETNHSSAEYQMYKAVQQQSAKWISLYNLALHVPALLSCLLLISFTDAHGRRFVFILASLGILCRVVITAVVIYFNLSFYFILSLYGLDGIMGSSYAIYSMSFTFIADITKGDNQRVLRIVFIQFVMVATTMLSSILAGTLIESWNFQYFTTSLVTVFLVFVGFFLFAFLVPESHELENRIIQKSLCSMLKRPLKFYYSDKYRTLRKCYILLLASFAFSEISGINRLSIETLYFLGQPFCWGPTKIGQFQLVRHAVQGFLGLGCLKIFQRCLSNEAIAIISTLSNTSSFIVEAFADTTFKIFMVPVGGLFGFLVSPLIRAIMSNMTSANQQGAVFAGIAAMEVISSITTLIGENEIYAETLSTMNGFVFLIMAAFCFIDVVLLVAFCLVKPYRSLGNINAPIHDSVIVVNNK